MKIGVDIDGVLNCQHDFCITYGTKFCYEIGKYKLANVYAMNTTDMFMWPEDVAHAFWDKYRKDFVITLPCRTHASEVLEKLRKEGHEIYIITARKNGDQWFPTNLRDDVLKITERWLKENHIYYDGIVFGVKNKGEYCKTNHIDIMIEDDPIYLRQFISTPVIVFDCPYNRGDEFAFLPRAYSWYDIYSKLGKMRSEGIIDDGYEFELEDSLC